MALCRGLLLVCVIVVSSLAVPSLAAVYTVGGPNGWTMGVDYTTWSTGTTLVVGDTLVFNYAGGHTVDEVTESDYKTCTVGSAITTDSSGATAITLTTPGSHYFICGIMGHCGIGMKLAVNVAAGASSGVVSSSQPPSSPFTGLPPTFGLGLPLPPLGSGLGMPPMGSGVAMPPSSFGFRSMNPSIAGSRNVNSEGLAPNADFSGTRTSLPDLSAANGADDSKFWAVFFAYAWALVLVFGMC